MKVTVEFDSIEAAMKALGVAKWEPPKAVSVSVPAPAPPVATPVVTTDAAVAPAAVEGIKRPRGRPAKVAALATNVTALPAQTAPGTIQEVRQALVDYAKTNTPEAAKEIMERVGKASKLSEVKVELYPAILAELAKGTPAKVEEVKEAVDPFGE